MRTLASLSARRALRSILPGFALACLVSAGLPQAALAEGVVPESDPAAPKTVKIRPELRGVHPRVLFTKEDIPKLRQRYQADPVARRKIETYARASQPFDKPKFLKDATDAQRQGFWRMPTLALHYIATGDEASRDRAIGFLEKLVALDHWETTGELDSGMGAGNIMVGAAMVYDMLYDELPPDLRKRAADKLLWQARAMIHGGHLKKNPGTHYWQNDPANNHRWHRDAGLALALLAVYEEQPEAQWAMAFLEDELAYIAEWLPQDGTNHEGLGYQVFGIAHLVLAMNASDHVLGTDYLGRGYFANAAYFQLHGMQPGLRGFIPFGDMNTGLGFYNGALYAGPARQKDAAATALLDKVRERNPNAFAYGWMDLLWRDHTLAQPARSPALPTVGRFPDLGITFVRDSWDDSAVAAMFKCGPLGGKRLNEFRESSRPYQYINVAHCDPDANSFVIAAGGELLAETSRYSKAKRSSSHNTLLVNGTGQYAPGRKEGSGWSQPARGSHSMLGDARILAWRQMDDGTLIIEGEAAGSYPASKSRPQIDRYRRLFVWRPNEYILILDDVRSPRPVDVTWLVQGPQLEARGDGAARHVLRAAEASCSFQLVADSPLDLSIAESTADNRGKKLGWQQLHAVASDVQQVRYAAAFAPWGGDISVSLVTGDGSGATVEVRYPGGADRWRWGFAAEADARSMLVRE